MPNPSPGPKAETAAREFLERKGLPVHKDSVAAVSKIMKGQESAGTRGLKLKDLVEVAQCFPEEDQVNAVVAAEGLISVKKDERNVRTKFALSVLTAMNQGDPTNLSEEKFKWLARITAYGSKGRGRIAHLQELHDIAGSNDPRVAVKNLDLSVRRLEDLPKEHRDSVYQDGRVGAAISGPTGVMVARGTFFFFESDANPSRDFPCKRQAYINLAEYLFGVSPIERKNYSKIEAQSPKPLKKVLKEQALPGMEEFAGIERETLDALRDVSLEELEENDTYQEIAKQSPIIARDLALYLELRESIDRLLGEHNQSQYTVNDLTRLLRRRRSDRVTAMPATTALKKISRLIELEEEKKESGQIETPVPKNIILGYDLITDPVLNKKLTPEKTSFIMLGLHAWLSLQETLDRSVAFDDLFQDLGHLEECQEGFKAKPEDYPEDHPIHQSNFQNYSPRSIIEKHRASIISAGDISISQALEIRRELHGLIEWRQAVNRYIAGFYGDKFQVMQDSAIEKVCKQNGDGDSFSVREEFRKGDSVPMAYVKTQWFGVKVKITGTKTQAPCLRQDDIRAAMDLVDILLSGGPDADELYATLNIAAFDRLLQANAVRLAKERCMKSELQVKKLSIAEPDTFVGHFFTIPNKTSRPEHYLPVEPYVWPTDFGKSAEERFVSTLRRLANFRNPQVRRGARTIEPVASTNDRHRISTTDAEAALKFGVYGIYEPGKLNIENAHLASQAETVREQKVSYEFDENTCDQVGMIRTQAFFIVPDTWMRKQLEDIEKVFEAEGYFSKYEVRTLRQIEAAHSKYFNKVSGDQEELLRKRDELVELFNHQNYWGCSRGDLIKFDIKPQSYGSEVIVRDRVFYFTEAQLEETHKRLSSYVSLPNDPDRFKEWLEILKEHIPDLDHLYLYRFSPEAYNLIQSQAIEKEATHPVGINTGFAGSYEEGRKRIIVAMPNERQYDGRYLFLVMKEDPEKIREWASQDNELYPGRKEFCEQLVPHLADSPGEDPKEIEALSEFLKAQELIQLD